MEKTPDSSRSSEKQTPARGPLRQKHSRTLVGVGDGLKFAKSPQWFDRRLLFLDAHDRSVKSTDLLGDVQTVVKLPFRPAGFLVRKDGRMIVADALRGKVYECKSDKLKLASDLSDVFGFCLGECVIDNCGGIYICDVGFDVLNPLVDPVPKGAIIYLRAGGPSSVVAEGLFLPGGLLITPDNKTLIVAENLSHRLTAFDIRPDGFLHKRRVWAQFGPDVRPDGICFDNESAVWVAATGRRALHVREGGEIDREIKTPQPVYAVALGGPERKHLFMCTSASNDPVITRRNPGATIDIVDTDD